MKEIWTFLTIVLVSVVAAPETSAHPAGHEAMGMGAALVHMVTEPDHLLVFGLVGVVVGVFVIWLQLICR
jgi:hydrogenase/urease accessory protein HupE